MTPQSVTPEDLLDLEHPQDPKFSPSADQIVYSTKPSGKKGEYEVSTLWLAVSGQLDSARPLTSGFYNDRSPQWNSNGDTIAFVSDRFDRGKTCAIYAISTKGGEPYPLTNPENKRNISQFRWSPNGLFIAYLSADEKTAEQEAKEKNKDDVKVYGEAWEYHRLRFVDISTRQSSILYQAQAHVVDLAWHETSKSLAIATQQTPDINSPFYLGTDVGIVSVADSTFTLIHHFSGPLSSLHILDSVIYFVSQVKPGSAASAGTIYSLRIDGKLSREQYGTQNDAESLLAKGNFLAIKVLDGLWDQIHLWDERILYSGRHEIAPGSWDVVETSPGKYALVFVKSTASSPREVYSIDGLDDGGGRENPIQVSNHGQKIRSGISANTHFISRISADAKWTLDGLYHAPIRDESSGPHPTLVLIHGGPYYRWTNRFDSPLPLWLPAILSTGRYGVLIPNYRGGSSHGDEFAAHARGHMGTEEYDDVLTLVDEGIEQGLVDKDRIIVGGWSQGGFLSYICAVRNGFDHNGHPKSWSFKGAIPGAGVTDWDMMCMTSDAPSLEGQLSGTTPWTTTDKADSTGRNGSAIWEMARPESIANRPPILILHGEADERVPVSQAIAFHRGCLESGGSCEMVLYPREPHDFQERQHIIDLLKRVTKFCDLHIGS